MKALPSVSAKRSGEATMVMPSGHTTGRSWKISEEVTAIPLKKRNNGQGDGRSEG